MSRKGRTSEIHKAAIGINARTSALLALLLVLPRLLRICNQPLLVMVCYLFLLLALLSLQCSPVEDTICNSANESRVTNDLRTPSTGTRKQSFDVFTMCFGHTFTVTEVMRASRSLERNHDPRKMSSTLCVEGILSTTGVRGCPVKY